MIHRAAAPRRYAPRIRRALELIARQRQHATMPSPSPSSSTTTQNPTPAALTAASTHSTLVRPIPSSNALQRPHVRPSQAPMHRLHHSTTIPRTPQQQQITHTRGLATAARSCIHRTAWPHHAHPLGNHPAPLFNRPWRTTIPSSRQHTRSLFIQTQQTPNSDAVMFLPGRPVMPGGRGTADFPSLRAAVHSPLARKLFAVDGVRAVFFGPDFVTVTKVENVDWQVLRPEIFEVIMDFFITDDNPVVLDTDANAAPWNADTAIHEDDSEVVQLIKELIETRIKPAVAEDGGAILFRGFHEEDGIVDLELQGACSTCSSSSITLKSGVENMLRHYIPEVKSVREVPGEHASPLEKENITQFSKVEQQLKDSGILRS